MKPKKLTALFACTMLIIPTIIFGLLYFGPKTIRDIYVNYDPKKATFSSYRDGDQVMLYGKVTKIVHYDTTYGNYTFLELDDVETARDLPVGVILKTKNHYHVGDYFSTTLHFRKYRYNNDTIIAADELYTPVYSHIFLIEIIMEGTGIVGGLSLIPTPTQNGCEFKVYLRRDHEDRGYPLDMFSLKLYKGSHIGYKDVEELNSNIPYGSNIVDTGENLSLPSAKGYVEFKDNVHTGWLDTGDSFFLKIPVTGKKRNFDSYILDFGPQNMFSGHAYLVNGPSGWFMYPVAPWKEWAHFTLGPGNETHQVLKVVDKPGLIAPKTLRSDEVRGSLERGGLPEVQGILIDGIEYTQPAGPGSLVYYDRNHDGYVNEPDEVIIGKTGPTWHSFDIDTDGGMVGGISWLWGAEVEDTWWFSDGPVRIEYQVKNDSSKDYRIVIGRIYGNMMIDLPEEGNHILRAVLYENASMVFNEIVKNGVKYVSNGTAMSFYDHDGNNVFNKDDSFNVTCRPHTNYRILLEKDHDEWSYSLNWST